MEGYEGDDMRKIWMERKVSTTPMLCENSLNRHMCIYKIALKSFKSNWKIWYTILSQCVYHRDSKQDILYRTLNDEESRQSDEMMINFNKYNKNIIFAGMTLIWNDFYLMAFVLTGYGVNKTKRRSYYSSIQHCLNEEKRDVHLLRQHNIDRLKSILPLEN